MDKADLDKMRKAAQAIYLVADEVVAKDISEMLIKAADHIDALEQKRAQMPENIAKAIFGCGIYPQRYINRIALKDVDEKDLGGLCLEALTQVIANAIAAAPEPQS